jgi:aminoglycoside phosphotransferase (APT) family kinase protein
MGTARGSWTLFQDLDLESEHAQRIERLIRTANFHFLSTKALEIRRTLDEAGRAEVEPLTCSIDTSKFASGQYNVVVELNFSDSLKWIARIRLPAKAGTNDEDESSMLSEIATMRLVKSKTSIPVPQVYGFEVSTTNSFGFRYMLMEAIPGHIPPSRFSQSVPQNYWDKITDQLADYYHQLSRLRFDRIGALSYGPNEEVHIVACNEMGPLTSSLDYFYMLRKSQNRAIKAQHGDDEQWATAAWILEQALPSMVVEDHIHGPFPLCHLDLHYNNILVDVDFNITGIIDWSYAQTVPLERFMISPEFVTFPGQSAEQNATIVKFRDKFAAALRIRESADAPMLADLLGTPLWDIVYRCTYSYHWRALSDARLVLCQIFGGTAKWEDFVAFYKSRC